MLVAEVVIVLWRNEVIDWGRIIALSLGGLCGTAIVIGIEKAFSQDQD